ncbi:MAG: phosphoribosyl-ATP diphosphatase [Myxococcota bacterium]
MSPRSDASSQVLDRLYEVIERRRDERPAGSYVVTLLDGGLPAISAKLREESEEVIVAASDEDAHAVTHEAADVVFHLLVLLAARGIRPDAVYGELARRFGIGGLAEKAARASGGSGAGTGEAP